MNYEEMVKIAYEEIIGDFEKEASTALMRYAAKNPAKFPAAQRQGSFMPGLQKDMNSAVSSLNSAKSNLGKISDSMDYYQGHANKIQGLLKSNPNMSPQHYQQNLNSLTSTNKKIGELNTQYKGARNTLDQARYNYTGAKMGVMRGGEIYKSQVMQSLPKNAPGKTLADIKAGAAAKLGKIAFEKEAVDFDALNKQTRDWNNGISRNISPTPSGRPGSGSRMKASDLLANFNNYTYKQNNGAYPSRLYK